MYYQHVTLLRHTLCTKGNTTMILRGQSYRYKAIYLNDLERKKERKKEKEKKSSCIFEKAAMNGIFQFCIFQFCNNDFFD